MVRRECRETNILHMVIVQIPVGGRSDYWAALPVASSKRPRSWAIEKAKRVGLRSRCYLTSHDKRNRM